MTVVINAQDIVCSVPAVFSLAHLRLHLLAISRHTVVPDTGHAGMALAERAVAFLAEQGWVLRLLLS